MDLTKLEKEFESLPRTLSSKHEMEMLSKSLWSERFFHMYAFYCPLCKNPRKIPFRSRPGGWRHLLSIYAATAFFTLVTWSWFEWKGLVAVVPIWAIFEVVYRVQVRAALRCKQCGFDPILYLVDVKRARAEVESHYRRVYEERGIPFPEKYKGVKKAPKLPADVENGNNAVSKNKQKESEPTAEVESKEISEESPKE